ncbi:MAG: hypothetical protein ACJAYC_000232 [Halieaceae bacterium]|jgi:hypothetical protein
MLAISVHCYRYVLAVSRSVAQTVLSGTPGAYLSWQWDDRWPRVLRLGDGVVATRIINYDYRVIAYFSDFTDYVGYYLTLVKCRNKYHGCLRGRTV